MKDARRIRNQDSSELKFAILLVSEPLPTPNPLASDPLAVLFLGSDEFRVRLRALVLFLLPNDVHDAHIQHEVLLRAREDVGAIAVLNDDEYHLEVEFLSQQAGLVERPQFVAPGHFLPRLNVHSFRTLDCLLFGEFGVEVLDPPQFQVAPLRKHDGAQIPSPFRPSTVIEVDLFWNPTYELIPTQAENELIPLLGQGGVSSLREGWLPLSQERPVQVAQVQTPFLSVIQIQCPQERLQPAFQLFLPMHS